MSYIDKTLLEAIEVITATLSKKSKNKLKKREESLAFIVKEFLDPKRRENLHSEFLRARIIEEVGEAIKKSEYQRRLPLFPQERQRFVSLLTKTSVFELAPQVLEKMVQTFGGWLEFWVHRLLMGSEEKRVSEEKDLEAAIRAEKITKKRVDVPAFKNKWENFSFQEALVMAKTLVAISHRTQPEAREKAEEKIEELIELIAIMREDLMLKHEGIKNCQILGKIEEALSGKQLLGEERERNIEEFNPKKSIDDKENNKSQDNN